MLIFLIPCFYGLFLITGYLYELLNHSNYTNSKLNSFYQSNAKIEKLSVVLPGDWQRVCYLQSHKTIDLVRILNRDVSYYEKLFWNFRVDFVDFDFDGGVIIYEKNNHIQQIEFPGIFFNSESQGCYQHKTTFIKKNLNGHLEIYSQSTLK